MDRTVKGILVTLPSGLHVHPATLLAEAIRPLDCEVLIGVGNTRINAKSIMGLLTLAVPPGETVIVEATGPDGEEAVERIERILTHDGK
jgi:phosphotransferase system HPr (HPr) family protein